MATRICPTCRSQYVASVRRCIDCDVTLVEEEAGEGGDAATALPVGDGDQIAYELAGWGSQLKVSLEGMLDNAGIRRVWEAGALVVPAADEEAVDALVAELEGSEVAEPAADEVQIAFEIEGVTADELTDLDAELLAAQIAHSWDDEGALLVAEADQDTVADLIDDVLRRTDQADEDDGGDGLVLLDRLTDLYVVVDKLLKDPFDRRLVKRFHAAGDALDGLGVPYGLAQGSWDDLRDQVADTGRRLDAGWDGLDGDDDPDPAAPSDDANNIDEEADDEDLDPGEPQGPEELARGAVRDLRSRLHELV